VSLIKRKIIFALAALVSFGIAQVDAVTISPQMVEQFKNLPKSEQERIAKQYGVDIDSLTSGSATSSTTVDNPEVVTPRSVSSGGMKVLDQTEDEKLNQATKTEAKVEATETKKENQIKRFGYDLFAGAPSTFAPVSDVPVPSEYMIGPGDTINIQLYGKDSNSYSLTVQRDGTINFPDLGPLSLVGMSFAEMKAFLSDKVKKTMIGVDCGITMGALRSIRIFVAGDAYKPGSYTVSSLSTITQALFVSGGANEIGSLRNIQLKRAGKTVGTFDVYNLLLKGDASGDLRLQSGDVVFIPSVGKLVSVTGDVRRPAIYELKTGETAGDLLTMASGLAPGAYPKASTIERFENNASKTMITVDLTSDAGKQVLMQNGDVLSVKSASSRIDNAVAIYGAVIRPGDYQWHKGMTVAQMLPSIWDDLTISADLDYGLVVRQINQRGDIKVIQFNLGKAISTPGSKDNLTLQPRDQLLVFDYASRDALLTPVINRLKEQSRFGDAAKLVNINGSVRFPGLYPLVEDADIKKLIVAAGGLNEGAYTLSAELTRQKVSEVDGVSITHTQINLQNALSDKEKDNFGLKSRDVITVRNIPDWQDNRWVVLKGEVKFPGTYSIQKGETLRSVLARAGGLTAEAAPKSAIFTRESVKKKEAQELTNVSNELRREIAAKSLTAETQNVSFSEAQQMLKQLENMPVVGRLVVDLNAISVGVESADVTLEDKDTLYIPHKNQIVSVMGQVQHPASHRYKPGVTLEQYLSLSGGVRKRADEKRIYILKADGSVKMPETSLWFSNNDQIEAGDTIIVPLDTGYKDNLTLWQQVTSIFYNSAVAIAAISKI
jgi:protein involved in polysaccharide export with SLBB domain